MDTDVTTTEHDVALDVLAALEMFAGTVGSESTTIDSITEVRGTHATLTIALSNGDKYALRVRAL